MVKKVDDYLPDHIGWQLWQAANLWRDRFAERMQEEGFDWYAEARSGVLPYVHPRGSRQSAITRAIGLTKQAVQQLIADLESAGIVIREPDPDDRRGRIVRLTDEGMAAHRAAARIKRELEAEIRDELGAETFDALVAALKRMNAHRSD